MVKVVVERERKSEEVASTMVGQTFVLCRFHYFLNSVLRCNPIDDDPMPQDLGDASALNLMIGWWYDICC